MEYKYYLIEFDTGEYAYIEEESFEKAREATKKIGNCHLVGTVVDQEEAFTDGYDIY